MKSRGKIVVCFASGLVLTTSLCASYGAASGNPYEPIVKRNIFNLNPPQPHQVTRPEPPSKITVDGIMTIFGGTPQALYKVAVPPHPPKPATEKSYILSEGQQQDGIEVKHIDVKDGMVTFNNHGVVQEVPLSKAPAITTPTRVVMHPGAPRPAIAFRGFRGPHGRIMPRFGNPAGNNRGNTIGGEIRNNPGAGFGNAGSGPVVGGPAGGQQTQQLTPEETMVLIAAEKAHAKEQGNPVWKIYPPTPLDKEAGTVNTISPTAPGAPTPPAP